MTALIGYGIMVLNYWNVIVKTLSKVDKKFRIFTTFFPDQKRAIYY